MNAFQSEMDRWNRPRVGLFFFIFPFFLFFFLWPSRRGGTSPAPFDQPQPRPLVSLSRCLSAVRPLTSPRCCLPLGSTVHRQPHCTRADPAAQPSPSSPSRRSQTKCRRSAAPTATDSDWAAQRSAVLTARHCTPQLVSLLRSATGPLPSARCAALRFRRSGRQAAEEPPGHGGER